MENINDIEFEQVQQVQKVQQNSKRVKIISSFDTENEIIAKFNITIEQLFLIYYFLNNSKAIDLLDHPNFNPNYINNLDPDIFSDELFNNSDEQELCLTSIDYYDGYTIFSLLLNEKNFEMLDILMNKKLFDPFVEDNTEVNAFKGIGLFLENNNNKKLNGVNVVKTIINVIKKNL